MKRRPWVVFDILISITYSWIEAASIASVSYDPNAGSGGRVEIWATMLTERVPFDLTSGIIVKTLTRLAVFIS